MRWQAPRTSGTRADCVLPDAHRSVSGVREAFAGASPTHPPQFQPNRFSSAACGKTLGSMTIASTPADDRAPLRDVDLIGTYSNHRNRVELLKRARRVADRLGEDTVCELVEARREGAELRELVERYEVSESSLKRLLRGVIKAH